VQDVDIGCAHTQTHLYHNFLEVDDRDHYGGSFLTALLDIDHTITGPVDVPCGHTAFDRLRLFAQKLPL